MVPINVPSELISELASAFGCHIGSMPFTYLSLPLGTTKPRIVDLMPLACRLERRLESSSSFLSQGARLQLHNSALASMPLHFLTTLELPVGFTNQLDRILRQCIWRDKDTPKPSLAAWNMICKPKKSGGLGIVYFRNKMKHCLSNTWINFTIIELPWVNLLWTSHYTNKIPHGSDLCGSLWWRHVLKLVDNFRGVATVKHGNGNTFLFWRDSWLLSGESTSLESHFPSLFSYAWDIDIAAARVFGMEDITTLFQLPLSSRAFQELLELQGIMLNNPLSESRDV
jgi:hypothetical protein